MEYIIFVTILLYVLSSAGYFVYLFAQKDHLQKTAFYIMAAGFICHTSAIGYGCIQLGQLPINSLHYTLYMAGWAVAGVFLITQYKYGLKILGIYASPLVTSILVIAYLLPETRLQNNNLFKSIWLIAHVITIFIGEASLALACGIGCLYLTQEHAIKSKKRGFFFKRLPSLDLLDTAGYRCLVVGFAMLTFGLITGFIYAKSVWGKFWSWDPKEVWSGITWLLYAALLHQRLTVGWRGRRAAIMAIIGFAIILFTFLGVNFLLQGHHGGFTRL